ncbi:hypothetical protein E2C01_088663 [Portunus trituberculatus]|uniref:Uncharacterized protein n=1 Tax=Portunus trituberculatus TaxID=210409 RepID=A0A5B7JF97_PORTR|nr:hypothetical protein [Portunus trituberculatus]
MSPPDKLPKILPKQHFTAKFSEGSFTVSKVVRRPAIKPATGERVAGAPPERPPGRPLGRPPINRGEKVARAPIRPTTHNRAGDKVGARLGAGALSNGVSGAAVMVVHGKGVKFHQHHYHHFLEYHI